MSEPKYPDITVPLSGEDGNIFFIIARVRRALRQNDISIEEADEFTNEVQLSNSYDEALQVVMKWVDTY